MLTQEASLTTLTNFLGAELQLDIFSPNVQTQLITPVTATVGDGVEFVSPYQQEFGSVVPHQFDIDSTSIKYQVAPSASSSGFTSATFNGYVFTDSTDTLPPISNVAIDVSGTTLAIDSSDVTFNENQIFINVEGLPYSPTDTFELDVSFAAPETTPELDVQIIAPSTIEPDREGVITVVYTNTSDVDLISPVLSIDADTASLTSLGTDVFATEPIQKLAISTSGEAGVLSPGESGRFFFTFRPVDGNTTDINFTVNTLTDAASINWEQLRGTLQPSYITDAAWNEIFDNFVASVGSTTNSYEATLASNATYLAQLGEENVDDVARLVAFELQQAGDYQSLAQRYSLGSFGRGRSFIGDIRASANDEGNVSIENAGTRRLFTRQSDGTYRSSDGDYGTLTLNDGIFRLTEQDGTLTVFNPRGELLSISDRNGNQITAEYGGTGGFQLTGLVATNGDRLTFTRNADNRITSVTDSVGRTTAYTYEGDLLTTVDSPGGTTTYTHNSSFAVTSITDSNGTQASFEYDDRGRLIRESFNGGAEAVTYSYGKNGEVTVTDATGAVTQLLLNDRGQVGQLTDALGRSLNIQYDAVGNATGISARDGGNLAFTYDDEGNLLTQTNPLGQRTSFTYEPEFNALASVTDPRGNALAYGYDDFGNLTAITYADGSSETFGYDPEGNVTESVNRRGQKITYDYNDRGQLTAQVSGSEGTQSFTYDARGNLTAATNASGSIAMEYDGSDRLTKITYPNGRSLTYTYDAGGRRTSMTDGTGNRVNYTYDAAGRLSSMTDGAGNSIVSYSYDNVGRLIGETNGNGTYTFYTYDPAGQLTNITNLSPNDEVNSTYNYTYNDLGQQTHVEASDGTWTYGYDAIGQIIEANFTAASSNIANQSLTYEYDAAGNRIRTVVNGETTNYTTNNLNQYEAAGAVVYDYDNDGNLISKTENGQTWTYSYNVENRLVRVVDGNGLETRYEYDALGNRTATIYNGERTEYLVDPFGLGDVVAEYDGAGGLVARYNHGIGLVSRNDGNATAFYDSNAIGSTVGLTNAAGVMVNRYSYLPFGGELNEVEAIANPFEFVGQWGVIEEANGLDFMRARFYEGDVGRFITPDPIGILSRDSNFYRYSFNNPISEIDPAGLSPIFSTFYGASAVPGGAEALTESVNQAISATVRAALNEQFLDALSTSTGVASTVFGAAAAASVALPTTYTPPGAISAGGFASAAAITGGISSFSSFLKNSLYSQTPIKDNLYEIVDTIIGSQLPPYFYTPGITEVAEDIGESITPLIDNVIAEIIASVDGPSSTDAGIPMAPTTSGRSKGEPHLTTFDGVGYSFQGAGEFTLVKSTNGDDLNVQVRYVEIDTRATVASAVATIVDGQRVVIDSEGVEFVDDRPLVNRSGTGTAKVTVDGAVVDIPLNGSITVGNSKIFRSRGEKYTVVYAGADGIVNDGDDQLIVDYMRPGTINIVDVALGDERIGQIQGLLGNLNGNRADDVALPDGTPLPRPLPFNQLYGAYRDGWRIQNASDSLFNYEEGQSPDTFYNSLFPNAPVRFRDLSQEEQRLGEQAALAAGYTPGTFEYFSAAFDFAIMQDPAFLEGRETDPGAGEVALVVANDSSNPVTPLANFTGADIQLQYFSRSLEDDPRETRIAVVDDNVEFNLDSTDDDPTDNRFRVGYSINFTDTSIIHRSVDAPTNNPFYRAGGFNGLVFTDIGDSLPAIENVVIDSSQTNFAIETSDITFTEDTISLNLESIPYQPGQTFKLDITFDTSSSSNSIVGTSGNDDLIGTSGNDTISGEAGDDLIRGEGGDDILNGDDGDDTIFGQLGNDTLEGGVGRDKLNGGGGDDMLRGQAGNDQLTGGSGNDAMVGGAGSDTYIYRAGDGQDRIQDNGNSDDDTLFFDASIDFNTVTFSRRANLPDDLVIRIGSSGDSILIKEQFAADRVDRIETFNFNDVTILSHTDIAALV